MVQRHHDHYQSFCTTIPPKYSYISNKITAIGNLLPVKKKELANFFPTETVIFASTVSTKPYTTTITIEPLTKHIRHTFLLPCHSRFTYEMANQQSSRTQNTKIRNSIPYRMLLKKPGIPQNLFSQILLPSGHIRAHV